MLYGERLLQAMQKRSETLGREIERKDVAKAAGTSVQNIGMILTNLKAGIRSYAPKRTTKLPLT